MVNCHIDKFAKDVQERMEAEKKEEDKVQEELKNGMWVDENF